MAQNSHNEVVNLTDLGHFPPTVIDHDTYPDGYDLHLLDPGTQENPRVIQVFDDGEVRAENVGPDL